MPDESRTRQGLKAVALQLIFDHLVFRPRPVNIGLSHTVLVIDPGFTRVVKESYGRGPLGVGPLELRQHIGDGC